MRNTGELIRERVSMEDVLEVYGFAPGRGGFIPCPFHSGDREPSLKIYPGSRGWHCFGCGRGGSVIDFVMELFHLTYSQAVVRMDTDFRLGLSAGRADGRQRLKMAQERARRKREEQDRVARRNALEAQCGALDRYLSTHRPDEEGAGGYAAKMGERERLWEALDALRAEEDAERRRELGRAGPVHL